MKSQKFRSICNISQIKYTQQVLETTFYKLRIYKQKAHGPHRLPEQKSLAINNLKQKSLD